MINEREQSKGFLTVALYERDFGTEVSGDFTLPDYYTEIRRILCVTPTVLPPAKYVGDSTAEFNGVVDYTVTYVGGDGELYSIPLSSDYSFNVPLDKSASGDIPEDVSALCSIGVESVNTRVSSPRRLSIRSRLRPNVRIYAKVPTAVSCDGEVSAESIHTRTIRSEALECESATSDVISVSYIIPDTADDTRVVRADAYVDVNNVDTSPAGVSARGEVVLKLLTHSEEKGGFSTVSGKIPFEGEIDLEGDSARVRGVISEMTVNVTDSGIECGAGVILEAVSCHNSEVEYTDDVYSTENECECGMRQIDARRLVAQSTGSFTLSERIPISGTSLPAGAEIIDTVCTANMDKCEASGEKYVLSGTSTVTVIYTKDGELAVTDVSVPMRYEMEGSPADGGIAYDCVCCVKDARVRAEGANLCIDAEVGVSADCVAEHKVMVAMGVSFGEPVERLDGKLVVCYPADDDTLWSIAKRYKVAQSDISGDPRKDRFVMIG